MFPVCSVFDQSLTTEFVLQQDALFVVYGAKKEKKKYSVKKSFIYAA